jgi:hypothetical protein
MPVQESMPRIDQSDANRLALIWEITQAVIAIGLTAASIWAELNGIVSANLSNAFFIIVGFYFGRLISKNVATQTPQL